MTMKKSTEKTIAEKFIAENPAAAKTVTIKPIIRQDASAPDFNILNENRAYLEDLIQSQSTFTAEDWHAVTKQLTAFQAEDGSFNLLDSFEIESDCRVDYCYEPTYIATALLMNAALLGEWASEEMAEDGPAYGKSCLTRARKDILRKALLVCCGRDLAGHGIDWMEGQIKALEYFVSCGVKEFLVRYPDICPEFTKLFYDILNDYKQRLSSGRTEEGWGTDYRADIARVLESFSMNTIFVYGTLMHGQNNHNRYLAGRMFAGDGTISGYDMYDLGSFPGIVPGNGSVLGEVYHVDDNDLEAINQLEGEGYLYIKTPVAVTLASGAMAVGSVYVYNHKITGFRKLSRRFGDND